MGQLALVHGIAVLAFAWPGSCLSGLRDARERHGDVRADEAPDDGAHADDNHADDNHADDNHATGEDEPNDGRPGDEPEVCEAAPCDCQPTDDAADADDPSDPSELCPGWESIGGVPNRGATFGAAFDLQVPGRVYLSSSDGAYVSDDDGQSFRLTAETPPGLRVAYPSGKPNTVYATTSGHGVYRSDDGGDTWAQLGMSGLTIGAFSTHPTAEQRLFAALDGAGIAKSADGGRSWNARTRGMPDGFPRDLKPRADQPEELLAAFILDAPLPGNATARRAVLRSSNGGLDWTVVHTQFEFMHGVSRCPANPDIVWTNRGTNLVRSTDGGQTWHAVAVPLNAGALQHIEVRGTACEKIFVTPFDRGVVRSLDGGQTWQGPFDAGIDQQVVVPTELAANHDGSVLVLSSYAGAFRSSDSGTTWTPIDHVGSPQMTRLAAGGPAGDVLWLQIHGLGLWEKQPGAEWTQNVAFTEPRGATVEVSPHDPNHIIGGHMHSFDGGASWQRLFPDRMVDAAFDPTDADEVLVASTTHGVFRSTDGGASYADINGDLLTQSGLSAGQLQARAVARYQGDIYAGTSRTGLWVSSDQGGHWSVANPVLAGRGISGLEIDGTHLVAQVAGAGIYVLDNGQWRVHNAGLASLDTGALVHDGDTGTWYLSSGGDIYRSDLSGPWSAITGDCGPGVGRLLTLSNGQDGKQLVTLSGGRTLTGPLN